MCIMHFIVKLLVVIGALNWGLIGFFNYNLVADLFGGDFSTPSRVIYSIVGVAGLIFLACWCKKCCAPCHTCTCNKGSCGSCTCGKNKNDYCSCCKGSPSGCNCGPNCPRCSCGRNKYEQ